MIYDLFEINLDFATIMVEIRLSFTIYLLLLSIKIVVKFRKI